MYVVIVIFVALVGSTLVAVTSTFVIVMTNIESPTFVQKPWFPLGCTNPLQVNDIHKGGRLVFLPLHSTKSTPLVPGVLGATLFYHPQALMADAVHGLGDTAAEVVTVLAYVEAARPPDKELQLDGNTMDSQHGFHDDVDF